MCKPCCCHSFSKSSLPSQTPAVWFTCTFFLHSYFKLQGDRFKLDVRKRAKRCWHRLPTEAVGAPSLEEIKARMDDQML